MYVVILGRGCGFVCVERTAFMSHRALVHTNEATFAITQGKFRIGKLLILLRYWKLAGTTESEFN